MSWNDDDRRSEIIGWLEQGLTTGLRTMRGANMFGSKATIKLIGKSVLQITTHEEGVSGPVYWEVKVTRPVS